MQFSEIGQIGDEFWREIPQHFPNVQLDEFVVMPNHVHGIICITNKSVETRHGASLQNNSEFGSLIPGSLPSIINHYKSAVTRWARKHQYLDFAWQPRFHDHIIRDDESLDKIRLYIQQNPANWDDDELFQLQVPAVRV